MMGSIKSSIRWAILRKYVSQWFLVPLRDGNRRRQFVETGDPVRYASLGLVADQILKDRVGGSIAECGVYKGALSAFLHQLLPDRQLFLFDTFRGFDPRDAPSGTDKRFADTSVQTVLDAIGSTTNVHVREGFFPETTAGLESERFALVIIDFDKYAPTLAALEFFYPRMRRGGFLCVHDYSSPESDWACSRALDAFLKDKPELPLLLPDSYGTAFFRKI